MENLKVAPVENYKPPTLPTFAEARGNSALLRNLPTRWKKKATVFACAGIIGMAAFSSFANAAEPETRTEVTIEATQDPHETAGLTVRIHHGGSSGVPFYVAYFTEQEALGIIREKLEFAGLNLNAVPPEYIANVRDMWTGLPVLVGLELFDEEKDVAIAYMRETRMPGDAEWLAKEVSKMFELIMDSDITVGVLHSPGEQLQAKNEYWNLFSYLSGDDEYQNEHLVKYISEVRELLARRKEEGCETLEEALQILEESRQVLINKLAEQVQNFIDSLYEKGILTDTPALIRGDVDGDGRITSSDATMLAKWLAGHFDHMDEPPICLEAADVNGDGKVDSADLIMLSRLLVGHEIK
ncbi:MAG: dockerin type I repeat-containing protein [Defluviitaleaceae bacterium]|nr:dockerin type I repeat-containing protein [Defluviitaleaceae bacterium]